MRNSILTALIAVVLVFSLAPATSAAEGKPPIGSCAPAFHLHEVGMHENHDHHIGLKVDLNGDGSICVKELGNGQHVHVDNVVR